MDCFDDDFAPLQSSDGVPAAPVEEDDAPLFLGDGDLEISTENKTLNSDGNEISSQPQRCKFEALLLMSLVFLLVLMLLWEA